MVVPMTLVGGVSVTVVYVVDMVFVRHGDVPTLFFVSVVMAEVLAVAARLALVDMVVVQHMKVSVMHIIGVTAVRHGDMPARLAMGVRMVRMLRMSVGHGC